MTRRIEDLDAIAPLGLGHVQRDVGTAGHLVERPATQDEKTPGSFPPGAFYLL